MLRKASGTPFKLRGGTPLKEDKDKLPDGVTTSSRDLGQMANDENHLVNVTEETITTPDYSGNSGKVTGQMPGDKMTDENWTKYLANESAEKKAARQKREADAGVREGYEAPVEGSEEVSYKTTPNPQPGTPGDQTDPFTAAEGRNQSRYGKQSANNAVKRARQKKNADNGNFFDLFTKKGRKKRKDAKEVFDTERSKIRGDASDAAADMAGNANDQLTQGRNAWRSGEKIDYRKKMSSGTDGQDFTIAPDGTKKLSSLTNNKKTNSDTIEINGFGGPVTIDKSTLKYGRSKSATPFKLNKYKK
tara:strand:+ start:1217 stop:2128 length:912 start_codon:yes stop_codon:yes gene_type:complete